MRTYRIRVVTNNPAEVFQQGVIAGFREIAEAQDFNVSVDTYRKGQDRLPDFGGVAGILVIANAIEDADLRALYQRGYTLSLVAHHLADAPLPAVMSSNAQGIAELMRFLVEARGRGRLVFLRGLPDQSDAQARELAFRRELVRRRL